MIIEHSDKDGDEAGSFMHTLHQELGKALNFGGLLAERWARAWMRPWEGNPGSASVSGTGKSQEERTEPGGRGRVWGS